MLYSAVCCVAPIVLASLTILSLPLLSTALGIKTIGQNNVAATNHRDTGYLCFCHQIARSHPDGCVTSVDGRLMYNSSTNELSAEVFSCIKYMGFTHRIEGSDSSSED